jgi:hypothetical protein
MKTYCILFLITTLICFSCNPKHNTKSTKSVNDKRYTSINSDSNSVEIAEQKINPEWLVINKNSLGKIKTHSNIVSALKILANDFKVIHDSIDFSYEGEGFEHVYEVYLNNKILFKLHPDIQTKTIRTIEVISNQFYSERGLSTGMTYKELKAKYFINNSSFNYDDGLFVYAQDFDGAFGLKYSMDEDVKISTLPDSLLIERIVIY